MQKSTVTQDKPIFHSLLRIQAAVAVAVGNYLFNSLSCVLGKKLHIVDNNSVTLYNDIKSKKERRPAYENNCCFRLARKLR